MPDPLSLQRIAGNKQVQTLPCNGQGQVAVPRLHRSLLRSIILLALIFLAPGGLAANLQTFDGARLVPTEWADGDSFLVRFPDGAEHTIRLYGADCFEWHVTDSSDAKRLREQRRYFGIFEHGGSPLSSIALAKSLGESAANEVRTLLARPFTVHTAFADARGDGRHKRFYGFITTADGEDLAAVLISRGLARAFGVYRGTPTGISNDEYREHLRDLELLAAHNARGAWAYTDWHTLIAERKTQRSENQDDKLATGKAVPHQPINVNTAARDELMKIPGVGEVTANAIIEARPYQNVDELLRVRGMGPKKLENIRRWVEASP